jgi:formate-dependent nitrite reductase membrane component NrfD
MGTAVNAPVPSSDSMHDPEDTAQPVATSSESSMPKREGWEGPTYYGRSQLKVAPFNIWIVGGYIFLAGLSGSSAIVSAIAAGANGSRGEAVARRGRWLSMLAPTIGSVLLIVDLHTPQRFYNMFRIAKRTSPMSIGTYILSAFMSFAGLGFVAQLAADFIPGFGWAKGIAKLTSAPAALSGAGLSTYTPALLSATSNPYWACSPRTLAVRFGSSSIASGAAALSIGERSPAIKATLQTVSAAALATELVATMVSHKVVEDRGVGEALKGKWGKRETAYVMGAGILFPLGVYALTRLSGRRLTALSDLAAIATVAGSGLLRVATLGIGDESAARPEISFRFSQPENLPPPKVERVRRVSRISRRRLKSSPD